MYKKFEEAFDQLADERNMQVEVLLKRTDVELQKNSEKTKELIEEITRTLGKESFLIYSLEELMNEAALIKDRAIYKRGFIDATKFLR